MKHHDKIYVAGRSTLIGRALIDCLKSNGYTNLVGETQEPDLQCLGQVQDFFEEYRPKYVFVAAGLSGGIAINQKAPVELMLDNLRVATNVIPSAYESGVVKLLYFASSCSYPRFAKQPMKVETLGNGSLESTNSAYATAKLAGIQLCQAYRQEHQANFIVAIPANAFGPGDDFDPQSGHVIPALIRRMYNAKATDSPYLSIWGTGTPRREFISAQNVADASLFVMNHYDESQPINIGCGTSFTIAQIAEYIAEVVGYKGDLQYDPTKPDGMPLKMLDSEPLRELGWQPKQSFEIGLSETYNWFLQHEVMEDRDVSEIVSLAVSNTAS